MSRTLVAAVRAVAAAVAFTGVVLLFTREHGGPGEFVFFTTQSNLLVGAYFLWGALSPWLLRNPPPAVLGGAVTLYIVVTFLIFHLVLANPASGFSDGSVQFGPVQNILLHTVTPVLALADWLALRTVRPRFGWAAWWLAYPLGYLAFVLVRGPIVGSYPYPFLDVKANGYLSVAIVSVVLLVVFWLLGLALVAAGRAHTRESWAGSGA
jgi:hypothetical protein